MKRYSIILIFLLFSCELVVDVDVPYSEALTLSSFFTADSAWQVKLTMNRNVLDDAPFRNIENGTVTIYENDQPIETLVHTGNGVYKSTASKPVAGKQYKITASAENMMVTSQSLVPSPIKISSVECDPDLVNTQPVTTKIKVKLKFNDPPNASNYYQMYMSFGNKFTDPITKQERVYWQPAFLESDDSFFSGEGENNSLLFKDILFDGDTAKIVISANYKYNIYVQGSYSIPAPLPLVKINLRTVSEDYYQYTVTSQLQNSTSGDPFAQPVNVYNNIENGYGIFAGYSESVFEYSWPQTVITGFSPASGGPGDHITITGQNFLLYDYIWVYFTGMPDNGKPKSIPAQILSKTENHVEVIIPQGAISGPISINSSAGSVTSATDFEVLN